MLTVATEGCTVTLEIPRSILERAHHFAGVTKMVSA